MPLPLLLLPFLPLLLLQILFEPGGLSAERPLPAAALSPAMQQPPLFLFQRLHHDRWMHY